MAGEIQHNIARAATCAAKFQMSEHVVVVVSRARRRPQFRARAFGRDSAGEDLPLAGKHRFREHLRFVRFPREGNRGLTREGRSLRSRRLQLSEESPPGTAERNRDLARHPTPLTAPCYTGKLGMIPAESFGLSALPFALRMPSGRVREREREWEGGREGGKEGGREGARA